MKLFALFVCSMLIAFFVRVYAADVEIPPTYQPSFEVLNVTPSPTFTPTATATATFTPTPTP